MKREYISDTIGNISTRHIREAESYEPSQRKIVSLSALLVEQWLLLSLHFV